MEKVVVKKLATGSVSYQIPGKTVSRVWRGKNAKQIVPVEEIREAVFESRIRALFFGGYLFIEDQDLRIELGLEAPKDVPQEEKNDYVDTIVLDRKDIINLLYNVDFEKFKNQFSKLAKNTKQLMIEIAIETQKHPGYEKIDFIKKATGMDIEKLQRAKREEAEENKEG